MSGDTCTQTDMLLSRFYGAEGRAADQIAGALVETVRPRVRAFLLHRGVGKEDLEDLCSETGALLLIALRSSRAPEGSRIADCSDYARTIAQRLLYGHIRARHRLHSLSRQILYLLDGRPASRPFARWRVGSEWIAGLAVWHGRPFRATTRYTAFCAAPMMFLRDALDNQNPCELGLFMLLDRLLRWLGTPLRQADLTRHIAEMLALDGRVEVSLEEIALTTEEDAEDLVPPAADDVEAQVIAAVSMEETRAALLREVSALPDRQRIALLLGMASDALLLLTGTAAGAAEAIGIGPIAFYPLMPALPLPDKEIAGRLGITTQQVSNLRKCARERLARRLARPAVRSQTLHNEPAPLPQAKIRQQP